MMTKEAVSDRTSGVRGRASRPLGVSPVVAVVAVLAATIAALPLLYLFIQASSRGLDNVVEEIWQRRTFDLVLRSLSLAFVVTALSLVVGVCSAFFVVRTNLLGYRIFAVALVLPLPAWMASLA